MLVNMSLSLDVPEDSKADAADVALAIAGHVEGVNEVRVCQMVGTTPKTATAKPGVKP